MSNYLKKYFSSFTIHNVLLVSDDNYFITDDKIEVEAIANDRVESQRFLYVADFVNNKRKPLYYKYHFMVVEEKYLELLPKLKYYFEEKNFTLTIILSPDYLIEHNKNIIELLENTKFQSKIIEKDDIMIVELCR